MSANFSVERMAAGGAHLRIRMLAVPAIAHPRQVRQKQQVYHVE
jgi:hypothetical protein